ncbi:hypothetical protein, partial [Okeania sp. SIO2B9]|uniref:hypothetical protein n=1 Tax=Okeania sp. SIO2B9 TaxID=2607782 RepID=UPI0025794F89
MLQIARIFLRSQPISNPPHPRPSQEGNSVGPSHTGIVSVPFFRSEIILFSWCAFRKRAGVVAGSHRSLGRLDMARRPVLTDPLRRSPSHPTGSSEDRPL